MARPRNNIPSVEKTICLPEDLVAKVDKHLYSELESKVPFGAWQKFMMNLLNTYFEDIRKAQILRGEIPKEKQFSDLVPSTDLLDELEAIK